MGLSKILFLCISTTIMVHLHAQVSANFGAPKFVPLDGKKLLIIGQDLGAVGGLDTHTNGYVDSFSSHVPAGVTSYTSLPNLAGLNHLDNWGSGDVHAEAYFNDATFNNSFMVIGLYLVGVLEDINNGVVDDDIKTLANWVKEKDRPIFLRIGYEFDGSWNGYNPTQFKNAWKHIVHIFDAENVSNVAYVWQSSGLNFTNIMDWYPGDEYVNWMGYSHFDGENMGQSIRDFGEERDKPIMIAEATPKVDLQNGNPEIYWTNWFEPLFNEIYTTNRIKALAYINVDWDSQFMWSGDGWGDSRVQEVPFIKEKWELEISKSPWITASDNILNTINYSNWVIPTDTQNDGELKKNELVINKVKGVLQITNKDNKVMDEVYIHDFLGRVIYRNNYPNVQYNILTNLLYQKPIIIVAKINGNSLYTKISY
ncbi:glycoside hydrolase family 26 protein [Hwangdonia lutea]|uniref:Glycosyl hydrolase n=1 Tax=Hwangdonia lutea TaxID=3075823 RepID=A0AA97ERP1_9FLAO|nr:glycosyl hydrolase [Hwangdonia sp. SCSIO 19198]WOD45010.1 glycosyl hydrolase [Hwangdonia sp. SCSIO 19198]